MTKEPSIEISPEYGLNPSISLCFYCMGEKNELVIPGRIRKKNKRGGAVPGSDVEAPRSAVWNHEPCDKCAEYMKQGVILVSVRDSDNGADNPYRTGGWVVVTEEAIDKIVNNEKMRKHILGARFAFVPDEAWDFSGLPRGEVNGT